MATSKKSFFHFTASERRGTAILITLCFILLISPKITSLLFPKAPSDEVLNYQFTTTTEASVATAQDQATSSWTAFNANQVSADDLIQMGLSERKAKTFVKYRTARKGFRKAADMNKVFGLTEEEREQLMTYAQFDTPSSPRFQQATHAKPKVEFFTFDPNTVTAKELQTMGVRQSAINNLVNYRKAGGTFEVKEDIEKLYSWKAEDYDRIADYIQIEQQEQTVIASADLNQQPSSTNRPDSYEVAERASVIIDINRASIEEWQALKGIGPYYAKRIVRFREALGGFADVTQVGNTHHLPDSVFQNIMLSLRPSPVYRPLAINTSTVEELKNHPYLNWKEARLIVRYREQHGVFQSLEDVQNIQALPAEKIAQLTPYLTFEELPAATESLAQNDLK
jgi:DNA uptake protein ComE-like DNA-binding protein